MAVHKHVIAFSLYLTPTNFNTAKMTFSIISASFSRYYPITPVSPTRRRTLVPTTSDGNIIDGAKRDSGRIKKKENREGRENKLWQIPFPVCEAQIENDDGQQ